MGVTEKKEKTVKKYLNLYLIICLGCQASNNKTPEKYINTASVDSAVYSLHKTILFDSISLYVRENLEAYYSKKNDHTTEVFIDTIVYAPNLSRAAFFAITKNSNTKLDDGVNKKGFNYDAYCFIAELDSLRFTDMTWLSAYNLSNYKTLERASFRIRQVYLENFKESQPQFKFNLNDKRFWTDPNVWGEANSHTEIFEDDN